MNKITLLLLVFILNGFAALAQRMPTGNLTIFSEDGSKFFLELNGMRYNTVAQTNVRVEELPNPYYSCKIVFADPRKPILVKKTLMLTDVDDVMQDVTYRIKTRKGKRTLNYYSSVPAQQNMVRPSNCAVYRCGRADDMIMAADGTLYTQQVTVQQTTNESFGVNMGGIGVSVTAPGTTTTTTTTTTTAGTGYGNQGGYNQNNGYNNGNGNNGYNQNNNGYNQNNNNGNNGYGQNGGYNQNNGYNNGNQNGYNNGNGYNNNNGNNQNGYGNNNNNNQNNNGVCRVAMNSGDFEAAKSAIKDNHFDDTKISTAKQIISANCMSATQVLGIVQLITFEEGRMDIAKYAYNFCIDKNNYYKVNSAFTFESSKTELNDFVKLQR